jgi:microcystin-dependent protein
MTTKSNSLLAAALRAGVLCLLTFAAGVATVRAAADANPPEQMTYQGFLVDANGVALGNSAPKNYDVIFRIYDDQSAGNELWAEQQTLTVDKGYFSVLLGEGSQAGSEPRPALSTLFASATASDRFVETTVKGIGAGGSDSTILPRLRLLTSPYAFLARNALNAGSLINNTNAQVVSITGASVGINKSNPASALDVNGTITATGFSNNGAANVSATLTASNFVGFGTIPLGGIIMWSGSTPPAGWALCDGQTVNSRVTPDLRGRFVLASGTGSGLTARTIGQSGGEQTHPLTVNEMPSHNHGVTDPGHSHNFTYHASEGGGWNGGAFQLTDRYPRGTGAPEMLANTTGISIGNTGSGTAHNTMPPYYVLAFIMRVQ